MIVGAFMAAPIFIAFAMFFVFITPDSTVRFGPPLLVPVVLGVVAFLLQNLAGFRAAAIPVGTPRRSYVADFQSKLFLRLALAEAVMIVCMALAFVFLDTGFGVFVLGALITEILLVVNGWPSERVIEKYRRALERDGGQSWLREDLGLSTSGLPGSF
ncbi:hypothetical protein [Microlunatus endophyticus]